jgi:hypothetical protein
LNHPRLKINRKEGLAFGETVLMSSPPSRSQIAVRPNSGFGGWVHEKTKSAREAVPLLSRKKSHPQHLTISLPQQHTVLHRSRKLFSHNSLAHLGFQAAERSEKCFLR